MKRRNPLGEVIHIHLGPDPDFIDEQFEQRILMTRDYVVTIQVAHQRRNQSKLDKSLLTDALEKVVGRFLGTSCR